MLRPPPTPQPGERAPVHGTHWKGSWVDLRLGLDAADNKISIVPDGNRNTITRLFRR